MYSNYRMCEFTKIYVDMNFMNENDKKKIFVYGYRQVNLGDDLFFYIMFNRYPKTEFVMCAPKCYKKIFKQFENVKIYTENKFFLIINRILSNCFHGRNIRTWISHFCDAGVLIMGSCFGENKIGKTIYFYEPRVESVGNVFILGVNVAEVFTKKHISNVREYFKKCRDVCVRESRSKNFFRDLENVRMAPDVVFQLGKGQERTRSNRKILFSVVDMESRNDLKEYAESYISLIDRLIDYFTKYQYKIEFMSFCSSENDHHYIEKIRRRYQDSGIEIEYYVYSGRIEEALAEIKECESVIATRFHSMILAWAYGKKVLPIIYNEKMQHVIDDYNYQGSYVPLSKMKDFSDIEMDIWRKEDIFDASICIKDSEKQFQGLDDYVYEGKRTD